MKEFLIDIKKTGLHTKTRIFASNQAHAFRLVKEMYPDYRIGSIKEIK